MSRRTTIGLAVVAVVMAAFIAFHETGMLSTGELEGRRGRVLERFVRPRVTDVEIERGETTIALHRDREEDLEAFEIGHWALTQPMETDADQDAVDSFLSALEWLEARRTLTGITDADRTTFGLDEPEATVRFTVAGDQVTLRVGGADPRAEGVYVTVSDRPDVAFIVGSDFALAVQHDVDHFRRKELFTGVRSADASAIELRNGEMQARLERESGRWWLREPWDGLARTSTVDELFGMLSEVRATRFLAEGASDDLARLGLAEPSREITVRRERTDQAQAEHEEEGDDDDAPPRDRSPLRLRVGGPCPDHEAERTAIAGDDGPIVCVEAEAIATLEAGLDRLRESRLSAIRDDELESAELQAGDTQFALRRQDDAWQLVRGEETGPADEAGIADWMRAIREQEASAYEPATEESLRARGLAQPRATLTLHRPDAQRTDVLRLGVADADGVWIRRGDEPQLTRYPLAAVELIDVSSIRFRDRSLVRDSEGNLRRLRISRGGVEEVVERDGSEWRITSPVAVAADRVAARDVARGLAVLSAVRFAADRASPEHGLDAPRVIVTATFEGALPSAEGDEEEGEEHDHDHEGEEPAASAEAREIVLRIGSATEGGAFARIGEDPAVLVIAGDLVDDLIGPLASRDLLATESGDLETLAIVRGTDRIELRREGDGWAAGSAPADEARTTLVLDRLSSMRAVGTTAYGVVPDAGLASPVLVLEIVKRRGGEPRTFRVVVGALGAAGDDGWYHAQRSDLDVGFRLGAAVVRAYLDYQP